MSVWYNWCQSGRTGVSVWYNWCLSGTTGVSVWYNWCLSLVQLVSQSGTTGLSLVQLVSQSGTTGVSLVPLQLSELILPRAARARTASVAEWLRHPPQERQARGLISAEFPLSGHSTDLNIGTQVATLPGSWRYKVSVETGWPGVSII